MQLPQDYEGLHNTDPFVFGGAFRYTNCKQWRIKGPSQLRYMDIGSVILFGSRVGGRFALDTVFVVGSYMDHSFEQFCSGELERVVGQPYFNVTMRPTYANPRNQTADFRLYEGATPGSWRDGMYSYIPCQLANPEQGFSRPVIELPGFVTSSLSQGQRFNRGISPGEVRSLWESVTDQVLSSGLLLGVRADMPR